MLWTMFWVIATLLLFFPAYSILREVGYFIQKGAHGKEWSRLTHPLFCLLLLGLLVFLLVTHHFIWAVIPAVVFFFVDGSIYVGWEPWDKANKGQETVRRGTRVVDVTTPTIQKNGKALPTDDRSIRIGGVEIPASLEAQHILIAGTTGAGKTQIINGMLRTIRKRKHRALIADAAGGFYARFAEADDKLFNPFDQRSVPWIAFCGDPGGL